MPVWPKSIFTIGASVLTGRISRRLRRKNTAIPAQRRTLPALLARLATANFWKKSGVEAEMTPAQFKARVPLRKYEDFALAIRRMQTGEADVLWPGRCVFFATTAGTTANGKSEPKCLPVTDAMLAHFRQAGTESILTYAARTGSASVFRGRHLFLGASTALQSITRLPASPAFVGDLSGLAERHLPRALDKHFYEPGHDIARMTDWKAKADAIIARTRNLDITLLGGTPAAVLNFAAALRARSETGQSATADLQAIWPHLECFMHGGTAAAPFLDELRQALGPKVNFHEVYLASEALIAVQDSEPRAGLRLMADSGVYYEFLLLEDYDESRLASLGEKAVSLEDVRVGVDYAVFVTTPAGLCRYALGDVVRFLSTEPPRLQWVGRVAQQLAAFGERVLEKEFSDALIAICQRNGWTIVHFHVAPLFTNPLLGSTRGRHEWWVELKPGTVITPTGPQMAIELDHELRRTNPGYDARRKGGLEAPIVRLVMPGLFEAWMRRNGKSNVHHKLMGCRNDRSIADGLAEIAQFAKD